MTHQMTLDEFNEVVKNQVETCERILVRKGAEYGAVDRLHNFRQAAHLEGTTVIKALAGMMAKHTVSVYDMCYDGVEHPMELWTEKITDNINYLILLKAALIDAELMKPDVNQLALLPDLKQNQAPASPELKGNDKA